ncbi:MAG: IS256 family transposase [Candidatus Omnitrophica bacterium]|jgi:transposase-like protein|nr:IS256 family transposase [Candidatus Omnitrophota bacterium]
MNKIPPSVMFEKEFFASEYDLSSMVTKGAQVMLQKALEMEVAHFLGRSYHSKGKRRILGYRNGYEDIEINSAEGKINLKAPQIRNSEERFISQILPIIKTRTNVLERLIPRLYVKGMSDRDIEDVLRNDLKLNKVSRSVVSKLSQVLGEEYRLWKNRDLSNVRILYLFIDGVYLSVRQGTDEKEAILVAYGITEAGTKILLHIDIGTKESYDACKSFIHDMIQRGLNIPLLIISDDAPGLRKAIKECFSSSKHQICQVHKMKNILSKLPRYIQEEMKKLLQRAFNAKDYDEGLRLGNELVTKFKDRFPSSMECLKKALPDVITCLKFPRTHMKRISSSNLIERLFGEGKRRTKVIPRFPTEKSCLSLFYATLIDSSKRWHGVNMSIDTMKKLDELWEEVLPETAAKNKYPRTTVDAKESLIAV